MPLRLLKFAFARAYPEPRMFREPGRLRDAYDAVIIGAGGHGLAIAYHLARDHGLSNVAVLDKGYIGGGNTGRNTAIVRSNYLTVDGVRFYQESVRLFSRLSHDLDLNLFYSERGHFTLAHTESALRTMRWRAEVNKHLGVNSFVITPAEVKRICPYIDLYCGGHLPIVGALYHPPGAIVRHDAVAWGYAREASRHGVEIHQRTTVSGIRVDDEGVVGVETDRGFVRSRRVVSAVAGYTPRTDHLLDLFPFLSGIKVNRQWAGMSDMTPDFSPIMGTTPIRGFYLDAGWGTWGFKATPVCGTTMAYTVAHNSDHELIRPFNLSRFEAYDLVGEKGAASVGH
jgi:sarcosine oxidase subunit beta